MNERLSAGVCCSLLTLLLLSSACGPTRPARRGTVDLPFTTLVERIRTRSFDSYLGKSVTWTGEINLITHDYVTVKLLPDTRTHDATIWFSHHHGRHALRKAKVGQFVRFKAQLYVFSDSLLGPELELIMDDVVWVRASLPRSEKPAPKVVVRPRRQPIVAPNIDEATQSPAALVRLLLASKLSFTNVKGHIVRWRGTLRRRSRRSLTVIAEKLQNWKLVLRVSSGQRRAVRRLRLGRELRFRGTLLQVDAESRQIELELNAIER